MDKNYFDLQTDRFARFPKDFYRLIKFDTSNPEKILRNGMPTFVQFKLN